MWVIWLKPCTSYCVMCRCQGQFAWSSSHALGNISLEESSVQLLVILHKENPFASPLTGQGPVSSSTQLTPSHSITLHPLYNPSCFTVPVCFSLPLSYPCLFQSVMLLPPFLFFFLPLSFPHNPFPFSRHTSPHGRSPPTVSVPFVLSAWHFPLLLSLILFFLSLHTYMRLCCQLLMDTLV